MASCSKDELPDQETDDDSRSDAPQSTTMKLKRSREVKVDDHHCQSDSQVNSYRQSSCSDDEAAISAVGRSNGSDLLNVGLRSKLADLLVELVCEEVEPVCCWPEYLILVFQSETQSVIKKTAEALLSFGITVDSRNDVDTIRYDTRCYFNVRSKADISQLNLPHGTDN